MILIFDFFTLPATHYSCGGELYFSQLWVVCTVYSRSSLLLFSLSLNPDFPDHMNASLQLNIVDPHK